MAVLAPTGYPPMKPSTTAETQAPLTRKRGRIRPSRTLPKCPASPSSTTIEERMKKGNREGIITLPHKASPSLAALMLSWGKRRRAAAPKSSMIPISTSRTFSFLSSIDILITSSKMDMRIPCPFCLSKIKGRLILCNDKRRPPEQLRGAILT
ncbi:hypothetical protein SDC9_49545 [bioreactor metagenome]|uniref:Uncharacterized protein n=1 Tax=bioreactor metagenome TaxID=1076179 RepID=A0A644WHP0_9ZZZZ